MRSSTIFWLVVFGIGILLVALGINIVIIEVSQQLNAFQYSSAEASQYVEQIQNSVPFLNFILN